MDFHSKTKEQVLEFLETDGKGLTNEEAKKRLEKYGENEFRKKKGISALSVFVNQFANFIVYVLVGAAAVSALLGEITDAVVIGAIIILNVALGFFQEYKAEKAIEALREFSSPKAKVLRNGKVEVIDSKYLVPGDILIIEEGDYLSADGRVIESVEMKIDESILTGESLPVNKITGQIDRSAMVSDRRNMVFAGTVTVGGRGRAVITNTGNNTELGKIATGIMEKEEKFTPLQEQLEHLGKFITIATLAICAVIFGLEFYLEGEIINSLITAVALAVAAIPEGLPAVVTITLALGTQRMLKKNSLIRRLPAVETLGSTSVICSDKTGTLTMNQMTVTDIFAGEEIKVSGKGVELEGEFSSAGGKVDTQEFKNLFEAAALCNNASIEGPSDPTEKALLVAAIKANASRDYERIREIPFSSEKKHMITFNRINRNVHAYLKGAPEVVLEMCSEVEYGGKVLKMGKKEKSRIKKEYERMAGEALRVIGFAYDPKGKGEKFRFLGLMGMIDPPRDGVREAINACKNAGIKVVMITGDYEITAREIGKELGIEGKVMTGKQLESITEEDLKKMVDEVGIYARVSPEHKVKILKAWKARGKVVAMTGDGVNDAPALKMSDIGTSVGSGTDVAKEASDMILLDDNFVSIVEAVREGRGIYDNIKKFVKYLFSCNLGEVMVILLALVLGWSTPLLAIQILWVNLLTDGFPALALGLERPDENIMKKNPRSKKEKIVNGKDLQDLLVQGGIITIGVLSLYFVYDGKYGIDYARTVAFTTLVMFQLFNAVNYKLGDNSIFSRKLFENRYLWGAIALSVGLQLAVVYHLNELFQTVPLSLQDWMLITGTGFVIIAVYEIKKRLGNTTILKH
ncbi:cation-translocating P-type ATPase [Candidatus Micrarchaeota archaeon]|nr:cation-translocating P-type ATPase [Candidatus Micrarchaeota archaeon]